MTGISISYRERTHILNNAMMPCAIFASQYRNSSSFLKAKTISCSRGCESSFLPSVHQHSTSSSHCRSRRNSRKRSLSPLPSIHRKSLRKPLRFVTKSTALQLTPFSETTSTALNKGRRSQDGRRCPSSLIKQLFWSRGTREGHEIGFQIGGEPDHSRRFISYRATDKAELTRHYDRGFCIIYPIVGSDASYMIDIRPVRASLGSLDRIQDTR